MLQIEAFGHPVHEATPQQGEHCSSHRKGRYSYQAGSGKTKKEGNFLNQIFKFVTSFKFNFEYVICQRFYYKLLSKQQLCVSPHTVVLI